jgi:hypothetical protein
MSMGSRLRSCGECGRTHYDGECSVIIDLRTRLTRAEAERASWQHIANEREAENRRLVAALGEIAQGTSPAPPSQEGSSE